MAADKNSFREKREVVKRNFIPFLEPHCSLVPASAAAATCARNGIFRHCVKLGRWRSYVGHSSSASKRRRLVVECGSGTKNYEGKTLKLKSAFLFMPLDVEGVRGWRSCFCLIAIFFLAHQKCFLPELCPERKRSSRWNWTHNLLVKREPSSHIMPLP